MVVYNLKVNKYVNFYNFYLYDARKMQVTLWQPLEGCEYMVATHHIWISLQIMSLFLHGFLIFIQICGQNNKWWGMCGMPLSYYNRKRAKLTYSYIGAVCPVPKLKIIHVSTLTSSINGVKKNLSSLFHLSSLSPQLLFYQQPWQS